MQQITLEKIYEMLRRIEVEVEMINAKLGWEKDFTGEESAEFIEGTRKALEEVDCGKVRHYKSHKEFLETFK